MFIFDQEDIILLAIFTISSSDNREIASDSADISSDIFIKHVG
ncbi:MAG TPA: hypothetical protein VIP56_00175 [Nitrososphaeraceae archaeon]